MTWTVSPLSRLTVWLRIFHVCRNENFRNRYLSFYWKKWFYIWYVALAWWLVPCLPFTGLLHIYFLFTVWLRIFHVCCNENFRNRYLSFYWKKWFYIWYMALVRWLVPCLPFPGLPHIYFLSTVRLIIFHVCHNKNFVTDISASTGKFDSNEQVGVFLSRRSVQHLVSLKILFIVLYWIYLNTFVYLMICFKAVILFLVVKFYLLLKRLINFYLLLKWFTIM